MSEKEIDCSYTREIVCPFCGHTFSDSWEVDFGVGLEGDTELQCGACDEEFSVSRQAEITYSSRKPKETNPA
jgi:hypothetical protein